MSYQQALKQFMDNDFTYAIEKSTKASWTGSIYMVELFEDGSYRIFRNDPADPDTDTQQQIGSIIIEVPSFDDDDYLDEVHEMGRNDFIGDKIIDLVKYESFCSIEDRFRDRVYERISNAIN
jgi:hypothetical protein